MIEKFSQKLQESWWEGPAWLPLRPMAALFGLIVRIRRWLYRRGTFFVGRLPVPVIVVGNLVVGGVGKTPMTISIVELLLACGKRPGVLSRGYGGCYRDLAEVHGDSDPDFCGDEPLLLKRRLNVPVFVGKKRHQAGLGLLAAYPDCDILVCDDGLQHYGLAADIRIALFDRRRTGNGYLLPAGPLREPIDFLEEIDAVILNGDRCDAVAELFKIQKPTFSMDLIASRFQNLYNLAESVKPSHFAGQTVTAVAGIGHPQRFFDSLTALGIDHRDRAFPDHHRFSEIDLIELPGPLLMTEKDGVKCTGFSHHNWWSLIVEARLPIEWTIWCLMKIEMLECLVCPICKSRLQLDAVKARLICKAERLAYPIENGIPVLLASAARNSEEESEERGKGHGD